MMTKTSMKKALSLLLALTMILSVLLTSVSTVDGAEIFTIYLKPTENWLMADARFAVYQFDSNGNNDWVDMTLCDEEEHIYSAEINLSVYEEFIFCRMNPETVDNNWNNRWNQTEDLSLPGLQEYCLFKLETSGDGWNYLFGIWAEYTPTNPTTAPTTEPSTRPTETVPTTTIPHKNAMIGDTDISGEINVNDVTYLQMYLALHITFDELSMAVADTNDDLVVDILDATMIQMYLAHYDVGDCKIGNYYNNEIHGENLISNGSFEQDNNTVNGLPSCWESNETYWASMSVCQGGIDGSYCLKLDNTTYGSFPVNVIQTIKGLEPEQIYRVNAYIKTEDIQGGPYDNGAHLRVEKSYSVEAVGNWIKGNTDWQEVMLYFTANNKGEADIMLRTDNYGIAYFDDIKVTKVSFPDVYSTKVALKGKYVDTYVRETYISGYTEEELNRWIEALDTAYMYYTELTGMEPFDANKTIINCSDEPFCSRYVAYGKCNPIIFNNRFVTETFDRIAVNDIIDFGVFHEMSHNFDSMYNWTFDDEITANYKMVYMFDNMSDKQVSIHGGIPAKQFREYCKTLSDGSYKQIENRTGQYAGDGICYVMLRATDAVGWDTVKMTFEEFSKDMPAIRSAWGKFSYFMYRLQANYNKINPDATGTEIVDTFPEDELNYLRGIFNDHYTPNGYDITEDYLLPENVRY